MQRFLALLFAWVVSVGCADTKAQQTIVREAERTYVVRTYETSVPYQTEFDRNKSVTLESKDPIALCRRATGLGYDAGRLEDLCDNGATGTIGPYSNWRLAVKTQPFRSLVCQYDETYTPEASACLALYDFGNPPGVRVLEEGIGVRYSCPDSTWTLQGSKCIKVRNRSSSQECPIGNPILPGNEQKLQRELDFEFFDLSSRITIAREFNSLAGSTESLGLGHGWRLERWHRRLSLASPNSTTVTAIRDSGVAVDLALSGSSYTNSGSPHLTLTSVGGAWKLIDRRLRTVESYDSNGQLLQIVSADGFREALTYSDSATPPNVAPSSGLLTNVSFPSGREVRLFYATDKAASSIAGYVGGVEIASSRINLQHGVRELSLLDRVTVGGDATRYLYEDTGNPQQTVRPAAVLNFSALVPSSGITQPLAPDDSGLPQTQGQLWQLYSSVGGPFALTGVIDARDVRVGTFAYDVDGRPTLTESAGVRRFSIAYGPGNTVSITDPLNATRTRAYVSSGGVNRLASESQPPGSGSGACVNERQYDTSGALLVDTAFNGAKMCFARNSRFLETAQVEGLASSMSCPSDPAGYAPAAGTEQRKLLRQWHPDWDLEARRSEPKKITSWVYNGQPDPTAGGAIATCAPSDALVDGKPIAVMCKQVEQPTSDEAGGTGFGATAAGTPRVQRWTYNRWGQVLTYDGARTDVPDTTTYEYYTDTQANWRLGDLRQVTNALGQRWRFDRYDRNGRLLQMTDPNGVVTTYAYTPRGWVSERVVAFGTPAAARTSYTYLPTGDLRRVTGPDNRWVEYDWDAARRLISISDSGDNLITYALDNAGNVLREEVSRVGVGSLDQLRRYAYDALGRVQTVTTTPDGIDRLTRYRYNELGQLREFQDARSDGSATYIGSTSFDLRGRPATVTYPRLASTDPAQQATLRYDGQDRLVQLTAANGAQTRFTVDGLGNVATETSDNTGITARDFDAAGNLTGVLDARSKRRTMTYDALNRLTAVTDAEGAANVTYEWDVSSTGGCSFGIGRLCAVVDQGGRTEMQYDLRGNLVSQTRIGPGSVRLTQTYDYDLADRRIRTRAATNAVVDLAFDGAGRPTNVTVTTGAGTKPILTDAVVDALGNLRSGTWGNTQTVSRDFDVDGVPTGSTTRGISTDGSDPPVEADIPLPLWALLLLGGLLAKQLMGARAIRGARPSFWVTAALGLTGAALLGAVAAPALAQSTATATRAIQRDVAGNPKQITTPVGTATYEHDARNRLTKEVRPGRTLQYRYDGNTNRTQGPTLGVDALSYRTNSDRLTSVTSAAGVATITTDAAGYITDDGRLSYTYDAAGRLQQVRQSGALIATYTYNAANQRVRKQTTGLSTLGVTDTLYFYDLEGRILAETRSDGTALRTYLWREDDLIGIIEHAGLYGTGSPERALYIESDHLGTPRAAYDASKRLVWRWESEAFGSAQPEEDPSGLGKRTVINLRMPGQYHDAESGLFYNWNRYYSPTLGRYMQSDPIGLEGGINTYAYVDGNPLSMIDPLGLAGCFVNFPDFPITVPGTSWQTTMTPGHAGALGYDSATGATRYYEYGRYDSDFGNVRRQSVPDLKIGKDGQPTPESMKALQEALSRNAGKGTRAELTCEKDIDEKKMYDYAEKLKRDANRPPYSWKPWASNTCRDFARRTLDAGRP